MKRLALIICIVLCISFFSTVPLYSFDLPGLDISGGLIWLGNAELEGGPSPLLGVWGIGLPLRFSPLFSIDPELSMFGTQYQLTTEGSKAVPTEIEYAHNLWALKLMLDVPFRFTFHVSEKISLGADAHVTFLFKIPTIGWGDASARTGDEAYRSAIVSYWYQNARFLYPGAGMFLQWNMFDNLAFHVRVLSLFPLFHAWDGESAAFWDQMYISGRVGVRISFQPSEEETTEASR